eukprot:SAG25_NODE_255_length_10943_cov_46.952047_7_plen_74_part_00
MAPAPPVAVAAAPRLLLLRVLGAAAALLSCPAPRHSYLETAIAMKNHLGCIESRQCAQPIASRWNGTRSHLEA